MQCPKCNREMEKGMLLNSMWVAGKPIAGRYWLGLFLMGRQQYFTTAWRCPNCKRVELYSE